MISYSKLCDIISDGRVKKLRDIIDTSVRDINLVRSETGATLLHYALLNPKYDIIKLLIDKGVDVNALEETRGYPCLYYYIQTYQLYGEDLDKSKDVIAFLVDLGFDINLRDKYGNSTLSRLILTYFNSDKITYAAVKSVIVDYSHTRANLEKALSYVRDRLTPSSDEVELLDLEKLLVAYIK
ncbi:ankyrin repeat domain-containing protein [Algivirga pacifica]|uniref:Ankyrin repeat-containing protein n=1 Tax=Algivirga pacifica TaxID=1162670 RepID=A0ABP9DCV1_9BACT